MNRRLTSDLQLRAYEATWSLSINITILDPKCLLTCLSSSEPRSLRIAHRKQKPVRGLLDCRVPQIRGTMWGGPHRKDHSMLRSVFWFPTLWKLRVPIMLMPSTHNPKP